MAKMNWNRPNGGYESEPWRKGWEPSIKKASSKPSTPYKTYTKASPVMTDEQRKKIQAMRKK